MPVITPGSFNPQAAAFGPWFAYDGTNDSSNQNLVTNNSIFPIDVALLDTDKAVVGYIDFNNSNFYTAVILTIAGNTISAGTPQALNSVSSINNASMAVVDTDTMVFVDRSNTTATSTMNAKTVSVSGTVMTVNGGSSVQIAGILGEFLPYINPYGNSQKGDGGDYHIAYRKGSSTVGSEVRNISGTTIGSVKASGSNGGLTSSMTVWGGNNGVNQTSGGGSVGGERLAWFGGNGSSPDRLQFSTFDGASTISTGTSYDYTLIGGSGFGFSRILNDDTVAALSYDGNDTNIRTLGLTVNNVTSLNSQNTFVANKRYGSPAAINTVDNEILWCGEENKNTSARGVEVVVCNASDVNTFSVATPVVLASTGSTGSQAKAIRLDGNRMLAVWFSGTHLVGRVLNRI